MFGGSCTDQDTDCHTVCQVLLLQRRTSGHAASLAPHMPRFAPKWTASQRNAILVGVFDRGMSTRGVAKAAAAGELGVPAFDISVSRARDYVRDERLRREGAAAAGKDTESLARALVRRELEAYAHKRSRLSADEIRACAELTKLARLLDRGVSARTAPEPTQDTETPRSDLAARLLSGHNGNGDKAGHERSTADSSNATAAQQQDAAAAQRHDHDQQTAAQQG